MRFLLRAGTACLFVGWLISLCLAQDEGVERRFTVLYTGGTRGFLTSLDYASAMPSLAARRAALIEKVREGVGGALLLLDSGDALGPFALSTFDKGQTAVAVMNLMGYHAMAIGNHDLDYGLEALKERRQEAKFAFLAANLFEKGSGERLVLPYIVREVSGVKVGILGLASPRMRERVHPKVMAGLDVREPVHSAKEAISAMRSSGEAVDVVIAVSHLGLEGDLKLLNEVSGIDLVIGVHRTGFTEVSQVSVITTVSGAALVYLPPGGLHVGRVDVTVRSDSEGKPKVHFQTQLYPLQAISHQPSAISPTMQQVDEAVSALLTRYREAGQEPVGSLSGDVKDMAAAVTEILRLRTNAEVAIQNRGGFGELPPDGTLSRADLHRLLPYDNRTVVLRVPGSVLRSVLQRSQSLKGTSAELVVAGVTMDGDFRVNGRPLRDSDFYTVATSDFLAGGGDGYTALAQAPREKEGKPLREVITEFFKKRRTVSQRSFQNFARKPVWRFRWETGADFSNVDVTSASRYKERGVPKLSITPALSARTRSRLFVEQDRPRDHWGILFDVEYGRQKVPGKPTAESADVAFLELTHDTKPRRGSSLGRQTALGIETVLSHGGPGPRPLRLYLNYGITTQLTPNLFGLFGLRTQRRISQESSMQEFGLSSRLSYSAPLLGATFTSGFDLFVPFTSGESLFSAEWENSLSWPVPGVTGLYFQLKANGYLYRDFSISPWAHTFETTFGLTYRGFWKQF